MFITANLLRIKISFYINAYIKFNYVLLVILHFSHSRWKNEQHKSIKKHIWILFSQLKLDWDMCVNMNSGFMV